MISLDKDLEKNEKYYVLLSLGPIEDRILCLTKKPEVLNLPNGGSLIFDGSFLPLTDETKQDALIFFKPIYINPKIDLLQTIKKQLVSSIVLDITDINVDDVLIDNVLCLECSRDEKGELIFII